MKIYGERYVVDSCLYNFYTFADGLCVFAMLYFYKKKKDVNAKNLQKNKTKKISSHKKKKQNDGYKKLFPNVMIDDDDENVDDFDKAIDDMMFMDLMDED